MTSRVRSTGPTRPFASALVLSLGLLAGLLACGDRAASDGASEASTEAVAASEAASARPPKERPSKKRATPQRRRYEPPKEHAPALPVVLPPGDPASSAALAAVASCESIERESMLAPCAAREAWEARIEPLRAPSRERFSLLGDDTPPADPRAADRELAASSCVAALRHESSAVRRAAYHCLARLPEGVRDPVLALRALLERFRAEPDPSLRSAASRALRALDPKAHRVVPELLALAHALSAQPTRESDLALLVEALTPSFEHKARVPESLAVDFALDLLSLGLAVPQACDLLSYEVDRAGEVCDAMLSFAEGKLGSWAKAISAVGKQGDRCRAQHPRAVRLLVDMAKGKTGPGLERDFTAGAYEVSRFVRWGKVEPELLAELREAVGVISNDDVKPSHRERLGELRAALR